MPRCFWCNDEPLYIAYHDDEWGVPLRDPQRLFELLLLEGFQAGLSWITVLKKRERYRQVLFGFDAQRLAVLSDEAIETNISSIRTAFEQFLTFGDAPTDAVMVDNQRELSCDLDVSSAVGKKIVTVEGLAADPDGAKVQAAWIDNNVPQCGFCQSGMQTATTASLKAGRHGSKIAAEVKHICVCGTYPRLSKAMGTL